jgi:hypothetical protein
MSKLRILWLALMLGLLSFVSWAQNDAPPAQPPPAAPQGEGAPAPRQTPAPPSAERRAPAPRDDVFVPSEELQADEEVTFPVDI